MSRSVEKFTRNSGDSELYVVRSSREEANFRSDFASPGSKSSNFCTKIQREFGVEKFTRTVTGKIHTEEKQSRMQRFLPMDRYRNAIIIEQSQLKTDISSASRDSCLAQVTRTLFDNFSKGCN